MDLDEMISELADLVCLNCDKESWHCHNCNIQEDVRQILERYNIKDNCISEEISNPWKDIIKSVKE